MVNPLKPLLIITASTYISANSSKVELDCKVINVSQKTFDNHFSEDIIDTKLHGKTLCYGEMSTELLPFTGTHLEMDQKKDFEKEQEEEVIDLNPAHYNFNQTEYDANLKKETTRILFENGLKKDMTAQDCKFTTFIAPQHGFVEFSCPEKPKSYLSPILVSKGFYPVDGEPIKLISSFLTGTIFGENSMIGGWITDEQQYSYDCKFGSLACAKAEFALNREQVNLVLNYINEIKRACIKGDHAKCSYHLLGRNCVDFVIDVAKVANVGDDMLTKLKVDENPRNEILKRALFSLSDKAWKYIRYKTGGDVNIVDPRTDTSFELGTAKPNDNLNGADPFHINNDPLPSNEAKPSNVNTKPSKDSKLNQKS